MEGLTGRATGEEFTTDYLCIGFPPVRSACKLTLTFPGTFITPNYSVTGFGGTAHLRRLHFWAGFLMTLNSLHPKVSRGPVSWWRCFKEAEWWNTEGPSSQVARAEHLHCFLLSPVLSPPSWAPTAQSHPQSAFPLTPIGFGSRLDLLTPLCDTTTCFHTNGCWSHTFSPPGLKAPGSKPISVRRSRAENSLALLRDEGEERMSWAGAHMCLNRKLWCFTDVGRNPPRDARHSPGWVSCSSSCFRIKACLRNPCFHAEGTGKQAVYPKACLGYHSW